MKVDYLDKKGKKKSEGYTLEDKLFKYEPNIDLLTQYVYIYRSNQRQATVKVKDRSEVRGGGRKPWKQKGTGRARAGSNRSPIWRGGGITFGPTGEQNYKKKISKKMKKGAFKTALNLKFHDKVILVGENPDIKKTKEGLDYLHNLDKNYRKVLLVQSDETDYYKYFRSLNGVEIVRVGELSAYDIVNSNKVVIFEQALDELKKKL